MSGQENSFFVGYAKRVPGDIRRFTLSTAALLVAGFGALGFAIGATQDDPGDGAFRFDLGRQSVSGVLIAEPYPSVMITTGNERLPSGHTLMLSGAGKRGVRERALSLDGKSVTVSGVLLTRGELDMLQLRGGDSGLAAVDEAAATPAVVREPLGRWRLSGEICDGKCLAGAMRPGRGIAHNACAKLCLAGGVPPVFVATGRVSGEQYLLMGDLNGGPLPASVLRHTAKLVQLEGNIERRGDMLVLLVDASTLEIL